MSDDLPNQNNNQPPPFGSDFHPHVNPVDPNNPYSQQSSQVPVPESSNASNSSDIPNNDSNSSQPSIHSEVAQHRPRDSHGHFIPYKRSLKTEFSSELSNSVYEHPTASQDTPNLSDSPNPSSSSNYPLPVSFTQNNKYSEKNDPPLVSVSVTNPVTYLKLFLKKLLKNEGIDIRLKIKPLTVIASVLALSTAFGTGFNVAQMFFPTSSPLLHRSITLQGNIQRSETGQYYLSLPDNSVWNLRPKNNNINLANDINRQVMVKGNMTSEANVIEVKEVIYFEKPVPVYNPVSTNSAQPN